MSRGAAYSFALAVIVPGLLAVAHIQTGKPLVLRTVHDTVYAQTKLVHDTVTRYRTSSPDTSISFDCRGDGGGYGTVSDPHPLDWDIEGQPGNDRLIVYRRDTPKEIISATAGGRHCLISRGPVKF